MEFRDWGEADFILLHADVGAIGIEAKGGEYLWDSSSLRKAKSLEPITPDPIQQALLTRRFVFSHVRPQLGDPYIPYLVLAAFPDMVAHEGFGPAGYEMNVLDRRALADPGSLRSWLKTFVTREQYEWRYSRDRRLEILRGIERVLAPVTRVVPLAAQIENVTLGQEEDTANAFELHADQLAVLLDQAGYRRTWTAGAAGTGKSLLAVETARALASQGYRVLFFTPNNQQAIDVIETLKRHGVLYGGNGIPEAGGMGGVHVEYLAGRSRSAESTVNDSRALADELLTRLQVPVFDALVVDEAQDLTMELADALRLVVLDDGGGGEVHLFGDPLQRTVAVDVALGTSGYTPLALTRVCRNSAPIHRAVSAVCKLPLRAPTRSGPQPEFIEATTPDAAAQAAIRSFRGIVERKRVSAKSIQLLVGMTPNSAWAEQVMTQLRVGLRGVKPTPSLPVAVDNFKGLESEVAIVVTSADSLDEATRRELYVGLSRAKAHLVVIAPPELVRLLRE